MLEAQNGEMIADFMVWHLGCVLAKYLDLYLSSDMSIYVNNILTCGSKVKMDFSRIYLCNDTRFNWITAEYNTGQGIWSLNGCF